MTTSSAADPMPLDRRIGEWVDELQLTAHLLGRVIARDDLDPEQEFRVRVAQDWIIAVTDELEAALIPQACDRCGEKLPPAAQITHTDCEPRSRA